MIVTTTALLAAVVAGFGLLGMHSISGVYVRASADTEARLRDQLRDVGSATVQMLAASSRTYFEQSNDTDMRHYVTQLGRGDRRIAYVYVLDHRQGLVAHSDAARNPREGHPAMGDESWKRILLSWRELAQRTDEQGLVATPELGSGAGRLALFALPVFAPGVTGSLRAALDAGRAASPPYGYVVIAYTLVHLDQALAELRLAKERAYHDALLGIAGVGALFLLLGTALAVLQGLRIARPIRRLAARAEQIASGDLTSRVEIGTGDEVGLLGRNFNYMADQLAVLLDETRRKAGLEKDLEVARTIQETLVPTREVVDRRFIRFAGHFQPASTCGGDWWTYHDLVGDKVLIVIGDATGHGVSSALITAAAKASCGVAKTLSGHDLSCHQLLEIMNREVFGSRKSELLMSCFASVLDPRTSSIQCANAGHPQPYLYRPDGGRGRFEVLGARGPLLGSDPDSTFPEQTRAFEPGDLLLWYTDGIVECRNHEGEELGQRRLRAMLQHSAHLEDPAEMRDAILGAVREFLGAEAPEDDITLVVGRIC